MTDTVETYRGNVVNFYEKFGFVSITTPGDRQGDHVYVNVDDVQADENTPTAFLVTGEYVQFQIAHDNDKEKCVNLRGIDDGQLLCDNKYLRGTLNGYRQRLRVHRVQRKPRDEVTAHAPS